MMQDLKKANEILSQISSNNKYITPITPSDYEIFKEFFSKEPHSYGNSWSYIIQGMYGIGENNLGYKYYDGENLSAMSIHPKIEKPEQLALYFVRPMGNDMMKFIAELGKQYKDEFDLQIYAKKLFKNQYDELIKLGFKDIKENPWHSLAPAEDDTYPEVIYDPAKVLIRLDESTRKKNIKKSYKKAKNLNKQYNICLTNKDFQEKAWNLTKQFFTELHKLNSKKNFSNKRDYYNILYNLNEKQKIERKVLEVNGKPQGYYVYEKTIENHIIVLALISIRSEISYLADYILFHIFETLGNISSLNIGGSEDKGIHNFKNKYKPNIKQQMFWATLP